MMNALLNIGLHNHMTTVLNAHLLVIDGKVYKDRSGKYGYEDAVADLIKIPISEISNIRTEGLGSGTMVTYDSPEGKVLLITTQPIKFQQIK